MSQPRVHGGAPGVKINLCFDDCVLHGGSSPASGRPCSPRGLDNEIMYLIVSSEALRTHDKTFPDTDSSDGEIDTWIHPAGPLAARHQTPDVHGVLKARPILPQPLQSSQTVL